MKTHKKNNNGKERLFEMMERVNKISVNEFMGNTTNNLNSKSVLDFAFNGLLSKKIKVKQSNTQTNDDDTFVELLCLDNNGNNITFTFKSNATEGDQDGVYNVNDVILTSFSFDDIASGESVDMEENDLKDFNAKYGSQLFDIIDDYIDYDEKEPEIDEEYVNAVKKIDSYPFGGGSDRLQTGKAYADEKPTNPDVRVQAPELNKYVDENNNSPVDSLPENKRAIINNAIDNLTRKKGRPHGSLTTSEINDEIKRISSTNENLDNVATQDDNNIIGYSARKHMSNLTKEQKQYVIKTAIHNINDELSKYGMTSKNFTHEEFLKKIKEESIKIYENFLATGNEGGTGLNETGQKSDYPDPIGQKFKSKTKYPTLKKKTQTSVNISEDDDVAQKDTENELEVQISEPEVNQIEKEKEETGDELSGGLGDNKSAKEFDTGQIIRGLAVELEHTDDPLIAMEIAIDHLTEIPDYYTKLDKMESGQCDEPDKNEISNDSDKSQEEMEDVLLGYSPKNVGDDHPLSDILDNDGTEDDLSKLNTDEKGVNKAIDEDDNYEEYQGNVGDRYEDANGNEFSVDGKVKGGVTLRGQGGTKETDTRSLGFMRKLTEEKNDDKPLINEEEIKTARQVLNNRGFNDGMSKKEAVQILIKNNIK